ncbi:hypothetical protein BBJ29_007542 [Phytophthora kernoviae]|uniref:Uncharacterized protein n=1 Tax=Phytophthora kernoviae TaxID=325452 RepID=A0A3F2REQ6_9STRA|nr:hypothetical protein BBP00_00008717 [Phytophthora kernoviae]RLN58382.1 hypothetical protein BBJ29_007542 [Phytophthora kernoviae]
MNASGLHEFWDKSGDFPSSYFVRKEEAVRWQVVEKLLPSVGDRHIVLVGSPGVGKSCFLMVLGFYMACVKKQVVLSIRRVNRGDSWRLEDLEQYARLTDWVVSAGLSTAKNLDETAILSNLVREQYFYSGGSLREFRKTRSKQNERATFETIVAYVHAAIDNTTTFEQHRLDALNAAIEKNDDIKRFKRVFVVVCPDADKCKTFGLRDAPDPKQFVVSFFNLKDFGHQIKSTWNY